MCNNANKMNSVNWHQVCYCFEMEIIISQIVLYSTTELSILFYSLGDDDCASSSQGTCFILSNTADHVSIGSANAIPPGEYQMECKRQSDWPILAFVENGMFEYNNSSVLLVTVPSKIIACTVTRTRSPRIAPW